MASSQLLLLKLLSSVIHTLFKNSSFAASVLGIFALIVIVHLAPGCNVPTFHVSICPFTVGCPTFGVDVAELTIYSVFAGSVSVRIAGRATVPLFP